MTGLTIIDAKRLDEDEQVWIDAYGNETPFLEQTKIYSPCCINYLAVPFGIRKYKCIKCNGIWKIEEKKK